MYNMDRIVKYECEELGGAEISYAMAGGAPWFKAKDITCILKHTNTTKALKDHVDDEDRRKFDDLALDGPCERSVRWDASVSNVNFVN